MNIIFGGPSGSGKTTLSNYFVDNEKGYKFFLSVTSRAKREGEIDGREYDFLTREDFLEKANNGIIQNVVEYGDSLYGYYTKAEEAVSTDNLIFIVTAQRALEIKRANPNFCLIFLIPPSVDTYLSRKGNRGDNRVLEDLNMLGMASDFDYIIISDSLTKTIHDIKESIYSFENNIPCEFDKYEQLDQVSQLYDEIKKKEYVKKRK